MTEKDELRGRFRAVRQGIACSAREQSAAEIGRRLFDSGLLDGRKNVLCYAPIGSEVNTYEIIRRLTGEGYTVLLPVTTPNDVNMHCVPAGDISALAAGNFGIPEPEHTPEDYFAPKDINAVLVPALAYDTQGYRLGYGKGFYDRFLPLCEKAVAVGIAYSSCVCDKLAHDEHDRRVGYIITENGVIDCG